MQVLVEGLLMVGNAVLLLRTHTQAHIHARTHTHTCMHTNKPTRSHAGRGGGLADSGGCRSVHHGGQPAVCTPQRVWVLLPPGA